MASSTTSTTTPTPTVVVGPQSKNPRPSRETLGISATDSAVRMMSETAHDVRAPLTAVRESVRLVRDGDLGRLSPNQQACLTSALNQCDCIDQMIGEMVQLERLRTGIPRVQRRWVNIAAIRHGIEETLRPWTASRQINLVWDINADHDTSLFADVSMIRRLIVNLVGNAIRETPQGGTIMIGVHQTSNSESLQWSVVDRGRGLTETEMRDIARRQISHSGGEGLGLSICRQLSALHFSPLRIESRSGTGTAVSFRTAAGGPAAVAERWSQWRVNQREPLRTPVSRLEKQRILSTPSLPATQQVRMDAPSVTIQLDSEGSRPKVDDRASVGTVTLGAAMPLDIAESFDALLQNQAGMFDLIYRTDDRTWVWVFDANSQQSDQKIDEINDQAKARIKNIRLSWSDPQTLPLDGRRTAPRLTEILVRQSLATPKIGSETDAAFLSDDEPVPYSEAATLRLDQEVHRLGKRLVRQTHILKQQASRLRPNF
ncbi:MAG: HAMP domain-containing sensor histidine kinase [Pirellulaceae bacterium]